MLSSSNYETIRLARALKSAVQVIERQTVVINAVKPTEPVENICPEFN